MRTLFLLFFLAVVSTGCSSTPRQSHAPGASAPSVPLAGPTWRLTAFGEGDAQPVMDEPAATASFSEDGFVTGSGGCNRYRAPFERNGAALTISRIASTKRACAPLVMEQERRFFDALQPVEGLSLAGRRLDLVNGRDERVLRLTAQGEDATGTMTPQPTGRTSTFVCNDPDGEDFSFTVRTGPGELAVWLPERFGSRYLVLGQARAASGAKYVGDGVVVWNKGDEALLEVDDEAYPGCTLDPRGDGAGHAVDFRAVGNEPGWHLEIEEGERIRFVYAYGEKEAIVPAPAPEANEAAGRTVYRAETEAHALTVTIEDEPCADSMSGEPFEATVTVNFDGETYRGCGRALH